MSDSMNQHKRMAMGQHVTGMKKGGKVPFPSDSTPTKPPVLKKGMKASPVETSKRNNGIPGMKKGGSC